MECRTPSTAPHRARSSSATASTCSGTVTSSSSTSGGDGQVAGHPAGQRQAPPGAGQHDVRALALGQVGDGVRQRVVGQHPGDDDALASQKSGHAGHHRRARRDGSLSGWIDGEAFNTFQDCVAEVLDIEPAEVRADARWREDLDADSLAVVEITLALNDAFSIKIPDVDPEQLTTVGQAFDVVAELVGV